MNIGRVWKSLGESNPTRLRVVESHVSQKKRDVGHPRLLWYTLAYADGVAVRPVSILFLQP